MARVLFRTEGIGAQEAGASAETNPYEIGTEEHQLWREGWEKANDLRRHGIRLRFRY
jgi:hypothetical protein